MKKVLITMALLTGMVAGGVLFSSFATLKTNDETICSINTNDDWTYIGSYYGYDRNGKRSVSTFTIWERKNACNAYYWVYANDKNPDETRNSNGVLRQNSEKKWYAALDGTNYFIDF